MPDDANLSELTDDDKLPADYPPDQPMGVDEEELTVRGEQTDEPLEERMRREQPDVAAGAVDEPVNPLVAPGGEEGIDVTKEAVATEATERVDARMAEEQAVHLTDDPPMGDGDNYG